MIMLHGSWLPDEGGYACFFIWGEYSEDEDIPKKRGRKPKGYINPHPYSKALNGLFEDGAYECSSCMNIYLPSSKGRPLPSPEIRKWAETRDIKNIKADRLELWQVKGFELSIQQALEFLLNMDKCKDEFKVKCSMGDDLRYWYNAALFTGELIINHKFFPQLNIVKSGSQKIIYSHWKPFITKGAEVEKLKKLVRAMPAVCSAYKNPNDRGNEVNVHNPANIIMSFMSNAIDTIVRSCFNYDYKSLVSLLPVESWENFSDEIFLKSLVTEKGFLSSHARDMRLFGRGYNRWIERLKEGKDNKSFRTCFRIEPPEYQKPGQEHDSNMDSHMDEQDTPNDKWVVKYFLQAKDDPSLLVPAGKVWQEKGTMITFLTHTFQNPQEKLLVDLGAAARIFPPLEESLHQAAPEECILEPKEAYFFLKEGAALLKESGFGIITPAWWGTHIVPAARLRLKAPADSGQAGSSTEVFGLDTILKYDWQLAIGSEVLTEYEFRKLARLKIPLVNIRGQWMEINSEKINSLYDIWEKRQNHGEMTVSEAVRISLGARESLLPGIETVEVEAGKEVKEWINILTGKKNWEQLSQPEGFEGKLRPYQVRGYSWLAFMRQQGLGVCLADDMGLGKTIQLIALLLYERNNNLTARPTLLFCPTSVVGNWQKEIQKFAPGLKTIVHHGSDRKRGREFVKQTEGTHVVISTYSLGHRDEKTFNEVEWAGVVLDEAQNIKNPSAKQTKCIKRIKGPYRVALTGTPVENHLSELWSIMDFLNPGYMGSQKDFIGRFAVPIEKYRDKRKTHILKSVINPFILRRVKTDPGIIQDLPEKQEIKVYCNLTKEQATLYEAVVQDMMGRIENREGIDRKGIILAALSKLKQVCNHPAQFLKDGSFIGRRSGKINRLVEMLEEILAEGGKALVFTQFAEMGYILKRHLMQELNSHVIFLHGGVPRIKREEMVNLFQKQDCSHILGTGSPADAPGVFILSLKAGGVGLNLTNANYVFHFDRWWNPAVENQATDRAFRIGQKRNVQVHKFICAGTLEERIDDMIEQKKELADSIVQQGEGWLTRLSNEHLKELFTLNSQMVSDE